MPIKVDEDMENSHENSKGNIAILLLQRGKCFSFKTNNFVVFSFWRMSQEDV